MAPYGQSLPLPALRTRARRGSPSASRALFLAAALMASGAAAAETSPEAAWVNVTNNVGGGTWGYAGVCTIACVPGADEVIAGVSEKGLWSSTDGGQTWTPLGGDGPAKITNRPYAILFDPKDAKTFWESGNYGPGVFKTTDGGKTFERLGPIVHVDGLAIDFADPERKNLLIGLHEKIRSVTRSSDGGKTWRNIGEGLPERSNHSTNPILIDAKTYVVNTAGWQQGHSQGIYRTEDAGQTWQQVSEIGTAGTPLAASDGTIYWAILWDRGLLKSTDKGKTWTEVPGPVKKTPIELPGGRLVAPVGSQLYLSTDGAATWKPCSPPMPFAPGAWAYNEKRNAFFISRMTDKKSDLAIARYDLPEGLQTSLMKKLIAWDGEGIAGGKAWAKPETTTIQVQSAEVYGGKNALEVHAEGKDWVGGGWNWHGWWPADAGTDVSGYRNLSFWVKFGGDKKPEKAWPKVRLTSSNGGGKGTGEADLLRYCPGLWDGKWHEVVIPLADLYGEKTEFDAKKAWEFNVSVPCQEEIKFNLYVDDIAFDDRPTEAPKATE